MSDSTFETDYSTTPSSVPEVDASLRLPLLHAFMAGAVWLVLGTLLLLISTVQLTGNQLFADCQWLTHGKTKPAAWIALVYGFALQMAMAVAVYVVCRRSRKAMRHPFTVFVADKLWNLGVLLGVVGVFIGDSTGHSLFELPVYASAVLFLSGLVITLKTMLVLHYRTEREFFVGQLYAGAGFFWFLWALATAIVLLALCPVPGAVQIVVANWYANSLIQVVLGAFGLGALCYFIPLLGQRDLFSRELAMAAFWMLVFIGGWTGLAGSWPLPVWISSVSAAAGFLLIVPVLTLAYNLQRSIHWTPELVAQDSFKLLILGFAGYVVWSVLTIVFGFPTVMKLLEFTHFKSGLLNLFVFGFIGCVTIGAALFLIPRLTGQSLGKRESSLCFLALAVGSLISSAALVVAGIFQGGKLLDAGQPFMNSVAETVNLLWIAAAGQVVLLLGGAAFLVAVCVSIVKALLTEYPVLSWFEEEKEAAQ